MGSVPSHSVGHPDNFSRSKTPPLTTSGSGSPTPADSQHISIGHALSTPESSNPPSPRSSSRPSCYGALPPFSGHYEGRADRPADFPSRPSSRRSSHRESSSVTMYIQTSATAATSAASIGSDGAILNCTIHSARNNAPLIRIVTDNSYISGYTVFEYMVPTDTPQPSPSSSSSSSPHNSLSAMLADLGPIPHALSLTSKSDPFALVEWPTATRKLQLSARQPGTRIRKVETNASVEVKGIVPKMPTGRWLEPLRAGDAPSSNVWSRSMVIDNVTYTWVGHHGLGTVRAFFADRNKRTRVPVATITQNQLGGSIFLEMATGADGQTLMSLECCVVAMVLFLSGRDIDQTMTPAVRA